MLPRHELEVLVRGAVTVVLRHKEAVGKLRPQTRADDVNAVGVGNNAPALRSPLFSRALD